MCDSVKVAVESSLWVEKYKPTEIDDVLIEEHLKKKFNEFIVKGEMGSLLLYGGPGNGKTTCARILARKFALPEDILFINASNESGIDIVRHKIEPFCGTSAFDDDTKYKIVILDEMEMSSENFQTALREMIERFYRTTRFILTCNFPQKVIDPLKSRTQEFSFGNINKIEIMKRCMGILEGEDVKYNKSDIADIIKNLGTDMRRIVNTMQKLTEFDSEGKNGVLSKFSSIDEQSTKLMSLILNKKLTEFREEFGKSNVTPEEFTKFLFHRNFEKKLSKTNWVSILSELADCSYRMKVGTDKDITMMNTICQIMQLL